MKPREGLERGRRSRRGAVELGHEPAGELDPRVVERGRELAHVPLYVAGGKIAQARADRDEITEHLIARMLGEHARRR